MSDHDPMCPRSSMVPPYVGDRCECWLIDRVRADERERVGLGWIASTNAVSALAVVEKERDAARAEVKELRARINVTEDSAQYWMREAAERHTRGEQIAAERDAARAEAASFSAEIDRMVRELSSIRMEHEAEVAALREEVAHAWAVANGEARR